MTTPNATTSAVAVKKNYLVVPRVSNMLRQYINPAGLSDAVANIRKANVGKEARTPATDALVASCVAEETAAFNAREASRKANADKNKKPFTAGKLPDFANPKVLAGIVSKRLYRNTKDFNVHVTGLVNQVMSFMFAATAAHAASVGAKSVDVDHFLAVPAPSYVRSLASYRDRNVAEPDANAASRSHVTYLKNMLKSASTLSHKKDLLNFANNLTNDLIQLCSQHAVILSNYNHKKTLTKDTVFAIANLLNVVDSLIPNLSDSASRYASDRAGETSTPKAAKTPGAVKVPKAAKAPATPKAPKTPKAAKAPATTPAAAPVATPVATPVASVATPAPAGKGKGKGKGKSTA